MALKAVIAKLEDVAEGLRQEYEAQGGHFVLKIEGDHPAVQSVVTAANTKVDEFRTNNIRLLKDVDDFKAKLAAFDGVDPAEYKRLKAEAEKLEKKGVKGSEDVQALINAAVAPLVTEIGALKGDKAKAEREVRDARVTAALTQAAIKAGVSETAIPDFLERGRKRFQAEGDSIVARDGDRPVYSTKRPGEPLSVEEYAGALQVEAPHLFKPSTGADTPGSKPGAVTAKGTFNPNDPSDFLAKLPGIAKGEIVRTE